MPLQRSSSRVAMAHNIEAEMKAGKPQKQAVAIAYAVKDKAKKTGYSKDEINMARAKLKG